MYRKGCTSGGVYVPQRIYLRWSLCTVKDVPLVEFMYLTGRTSGGVYVPCMPGDSYRRRLRSLLLCVYDVFRLVCRLCVRQLSL